jgi:phenylacetate-CoA ligase
LEPSPYHPDVERLSRAEIAGLQLARLRRQVDRCWSAAPFYRERWQAAGFRPDQLASLDDVRRIPLVTKEDLRREQEEHPPFGRYVAAPADAWAELHPSSGTTGSPVNTVWSREDVRAISAFTARTLWSFGVRPGDVIQNSFSYGLWVAGLAVHHAAREIGCFVVPAGTAPTERQLFFLTHVRPTVFIATPSFGLHVAERARQAGIDPRSLALRIGAFGGEAGTEVPGTRRQLEEGLALDAYDYYGLAEIAPTFAAECTAKAGLHWAEDHFLVEFLAPDSLTPVAPGEVGVVVITHLTREATPMVRYWTNDYATFDPAPCTCGRTHLRSPGGILGRHDDLIVYRGAKFYPLQVERVVRSFAELTHEYRVELERDARTGSETCTVVAELAVDEEPAGLAERLTSALRAECLVRPAVRLVPRGAIERTAFKARRVVDARRQADVPGAGRG